jgi:hypothetical protein
MTRDPELTPQFTAWLDTWVEVTASATSGKPAGVLPSAIHFPDGRIGGSGGKWYATQGFSALYDWPWYVSDMLHVMLIAHKMTGEDKYLEPIRSMARLRADYLKRHQSTAAGSADGIALAYFSRPMSAADPAAGLEPGSADWCAAQMGEILPGVLMGYRVLTNDKQFDDVLRRDGDGYMRYLLDGDRADLANRLRSVADAFSINHEMYTTEVRWTDRVFRFPAGYLSNFQDPPLPQPNTRLIYAAATGDPVTWVGGRMAAVRWRTPPKDIAALVTQSGPTSFAAELYHFGDGDREFDAELMLLTKGWYELTVHADGRELQRSSLVVEGPRTLAHLKLPARTLCVVNVSSVEKMKTSSVQPDVLAPWRGAVARPVLSNVAGHTLHSYFGISPESPDEKSVLLFRSSREDGQLGDIVMVDRATGQTTTLAEAVETEDGHRQANQQWTCGGRYVAYMSLRDGQWDVIRVDTQNLSRKTLATGRQLGWGQPNLDVIPLYGTHWNPGEHRDFELLNVRTGEIRTIVTVEQVVAEHRQYLEKTFGGTNVSLFFPQMSPDGKRAFFKMSSPRDGQMRSENASLRDGMFVYDLAAGRLLGKNDFWGHPAWFSDSRHVQSCQFVTDTDTMQVRTLPNIPMPFGGVHASPSPDGSLVVTDISKKDYLSPRNNWTIWMIDPTDGRHETMHVAPVTGDGTTSWRPTHPHPSFNACGNRVYFNVIGRLCSTLHVVERNDDAAK